MRILKGAGKLLLVAALWASYIFLLDQMLIRFFWLSQPSWLSWWQGGADIHFMWYRILGHSIAIVLATLPVAYAVAKIFPKHFIWAAIVIIFLSRFPWIASSLNLEQLERNASRGTVYLVGYVLDIFKLYFLLPLLTWMIARFVISNNALQRTNHG